MLRRLGVRAVTRDVVLSFSAMCRHALHWQSGAITNDSVNFVGPVTCSRAEQSLLGLGTRFIPSVRAGQGTLQPSIDALSRRIRLAVFFKDGRKPPEFNGSTTPDMIRSINACWRAGNPAYTPPNASPRIEHAIHALSASLSRPPRLPQPYHRSNLSPAHALALHTLRQRQDIVIREADKNLGTTVMDVGWYRQQVYSHLQDASSYVLSQRTEQDTITSIRNAIKRTPHMAQLLHQKVIQRILDDSNSSIPVFYVMPKLHKVPISSRPIAANVRSPTTVIARILSNVLQELSSTDPWVIKDSLSLVQDINAGADFQFRSPTDLLFTIDVEALYPSIDIPILLSIVETRLSHHLAPTGGGQLVQLLMAWLRITVWNSYVSFDGCIYKQIRGIPMGVACCTHLGNMYVSHFVSPIVQQHKALGHISQARGYIDDILGIWCGPAQLFPSFMSTLNNLHPSLKFTHTTSPSKVVFLDLELSKPSSLEARTTPATQVHRKALNRFLYIPFSSEHPPHTLRAFIRSEAVRYIRLSSNRDSASRTIQLFVSALVQRGYPVPVIMTALQGLCYSSRSSLLHLSSSRRVDSAVKLPFVLEFNQANHHATAASRPAFRNLEACISSELGTETRIITAWKLGQSLHAKLKLQHPK